MNDVWCTAGSLIVGDSMSLSDHWTYCVNGQSLLSTMPIEIASEGYAALLSPEIRATIDDRYAHTATFCTKLCLAAIENITDRYPIDFSKTAIIVATTKGDINLLYGDYVGKASTNSYLGQISKFLDAYFKPQMPTMVVSTACISGNLAIQIGANLLVQGKATHAVIVGVDLVSRFTVTGFQSLKAMSPEPARPFDKDRNGISLGEGVSAIFLSIEKQPFEGRHFIKYIGGCTTNDANHISGPSREGLGLIEAIKGACPTNGFTPDFFNLHGTGTIYNDQMEAQALHTLKLTSTDVWGLKGIYGHTFGMAGVLETLLCMQALVTNQLPLTVGYETSGTDPELNITRQTNEKNLRAFIKCTSGFGGGNSVLAFEKDGL